MKIAIIIPVFNRRETTLKCLGLLKNNVLIPDDTLLQIIVVDDGSTDGTATAIGQAYPEVKILTGDGNLWWTGAINKGVEFALSQNFDYLLTLNDDMEFDDDFLLQLLAVANKNQQALVSSLKLNKRPDGKKQIITAGFNVTGFLKQIDTIHADKLLDDIQLDEVITCDIVTGASLLIPALVFKTIGSFDNANFPHHWGDFEFSHRAFLAGFPCMVATKSKIYTDYNQNYATPFLLASTKTQYIKSLFNNTRYYHGFISLFKSSYMHKNIFIGSILFAKRLAGLSKNILLKLILPNQLLRIIFNPKG